MPPRRTSSAGADGHPAAGPGRRASLLARSRMAGRSPYTPGGLALLALAGLAIAFAGALGPGDLGRRLADHHRAARRVTPGRR